MRKFIVVGGGISGLSTAFHLFKRFPKSTVTLLEKNSVLGGTIKTTKVKDSYYCEEGPRSIRNSKYSVQLNQIIDEVGLREKGSSPLQKTNAKFYPAKGFHIHIFTGMANLDIFPSR